MLFEVLRIVFMAAGSSVVEGILRRNSSTALHVGCKGWLIVGRCGASFRCLSADCNDHGTSILITRPLNLTGRLDWRGPAKTRRQTQGVARVGA